MAYNTSTEGIPLKDNDGFARIRKFRTSQKLQRNSFSFYYEVYRYIMSLWLNARRNKKT